MSPVLSLGPIPADWRCSASWRHWSVPGATRRKSISTLEALLGLEGPEAVRIQPAALNGLADGMGRRGARLADFLAKLPDDGNTDRADSISIGPATCCASRRGRRGRWPSPGGPPRRHAPAGPCPLGGGRADALAPADRGSVAGDPARRRPGTGRPHPSRGGRPAAGSLVESYLPAVRGEVAAALLRRADRIGKLLDAVEAGRVRPGDLDATATRRLVDSTVPAIRDRARTLLQASLARRAEVLERYAPAIETVGDPLRGREVFRKTCATCHKVDDIGTDVGPDIADTRAQTREALLTNILDPNRAIDGNYVSYIVAARDGQVFEGLIAAETGSSLTLRRAEGQQDVLLRQDIEELRSTGLSLMPEGLEEDISVEQMADLLTFLKDWRYLDGDVPLGREASSR